MFFQVNVEKSIDLCRIWTIIEVFISKWCSFVSTANEDYLTGFNVVDIMYIHRKWISFIFEALKHQNCLKYNNYLRKQLCPSIFCTIQMLNTDECFLFIFGVVKFIRHVSNTAIIYEGNMLGCTNHVKSIHSNFVISRNHWPALTILTVWDDKTSRISQILSLFHHHTSPQDAHPRIRSTGQSASQQHTYYSAHRGTVYGEWHLALPLRKGYWSED